MFDPNDILHRNTTLKMGVVLKVLHPKDEDNESQIITEYNVLAIEQDRQFGMNTTLFKNCIVLESFGGIADFFEYKLRATKDPEKLKKEAKIDENEEGALVLLLCLDGSSEKAIIIGSMKNPSRETTLTKDNEKHLEGEYNGINWQINKDGEFTITFKSATDNAGEYADEEAGGTSIKLDKTGSLEYDDGKSNKLKLDKKEEQLDIEVGKKINIKAGDEMAIETPKNLSISSKDLVCNASGKAAISSASEMNFEAGGDFKAKGVQVEISGDSQINLKSTMINLKGSQISLGEGGMPALTMSLQVIGVGNLGAPVISTPMSGFSSTVTIAS
jgi:hypothetical protein